jgi:hypothetical protein
MPVRVPTEIWGLANGEEKPEQKQQRNEHGENGERFQSKGRDMLVTEARRDGNAAREVLDAARPAADGAVTVVSIRQPTGVFARSVL